MVLKQNNWAGRRPCATFDAGICIHWTWFNEFSRLAFPFLGSSTLSPSTQRLDDNTTGIDQQRIPIVEACDFIQVNLEGANAASRRGQGGRGCQDPRLKKGDCEEQWENVCVFPLRIPCSATFTKDSQIPLKCDHNFVAILKVVLWQRSFKLFPRKLSICLCLFLIQ